MELTQIPFVTITYKEKDYVKLLNGNDNITDEDLFAAFENAINYLINFNNE